MKNELLCKKIKDNLLKWYPAIIIIIAVVSIIPILMISKYNHPSADDFGYSKNVHYAAEEGASVGEIINIAVDTSKGYMQNWQRLYTSAFLLALQPAAFGEQYYALTAFIILVFMFIGIMTLSHSISNNILKNKSKTSYLVGLIVFLYVIQGIPDPVEGIFWFNGAVNYLFFWGIMLLNFALAIRYYNNKNAYVSLVVSIILCFLISGGNHVTAFVNILFCVGLVVFSVVNKRAFMTMLPALSAIIGFVINLTAPGTRVRMQSNGVDSSVIKTVIRCGYEALVCNTYFVTFTFIVMLVVITPFIIKLFDNSERKVEFKGIVMIGMLVADFVIIAAMYCVPYYAMGVFGEGRVEDTIYATYVILMVITYAYFVGYIRTVEFTREFVHKCENTIKDNATVCVVMTLCSICLVAYIAVVGNGLKGYSTGFKALVDMNEAKAYDMEYSKRIDILHDESIKDAELDAFTNKPYLLFFVDIEEDASHWSNTSVAEYYKKDSVYRKEAVE